MSEKFKTLSFEQLACVYAHWKELACLPEGWAANFDGGFYYFRSADSSKVVAEMRFQRQQGRTCQGGPVDGQHECYLNVGFIPAAREPR